MAEEIKMQDVLDQDFLQKFQDQFSKAVGVAAITVDNNGTPITRPSGFTDFCMKYTRESSLGCQRCMACDKKGGEQSAKTGRPSVYDCHAGLVDFGTPVVVNGKQIGSIIGGQVLTSPVNEDKIRQVAREIGVDPEAYLAAAKKVPVVPRENVDAAAELLFTVSTTVSEMGYFRHTLKTLTETINDTLSHVSATMEELAASAHDVDQNQSDLNVEIQKVNEVAGKINEFTKLIQSIAKQTRLLGLNASIEAARAGTAGAGFGVVAEEIGKLANNSSDTVESIQGFMDKIRESVAATVSKGATTSEIVAQQTAAIESNAKDLTELAEMATKLYDFAHKR
ncbi:MAG: PocR ligand-binding domain-containing protein [Selenomonadaceae bacterium]